MGNLAARTVKITGDSPEQTVVAYGSLEPLQDFGALCSIGRAGRIADFRCGCELTVGHRESGNSDELRVAFAATAWQRSELRESGRSPQERKGLMPSAEADIRLTVRPRPA